MPQIEPIAFLMTRRHDGSNLSDRAPNRALSYAPTPSPPSRDFLLHLHHPGLCSFKRSPLSLDVSSMNISPSVLLRGGTLNSAGDRSGFQPAKEYDKLCRRHVSCAKVSVNVFWRPGVAAAEESHELEPFNSACATSAADHLVRGGDDCGRAERVALVHLLHFGWAAGRRLRWRTNHRASALEGQLRIGHLQSSQWRNGFAGWHLLPRSGRWHRLGCEAAGQIAACLRHPLSSYPGHQARTRLAAARPGKMAGHASAKQEPVSTPFASTGASATFLCVRLLPRSNLTNHCPRSSERRWCETTARREACW